MRRYGLILILILLCYNAMAHRESDTLGVGTTISFVENRGQWQHPYRYEAQMHDAALFLDAEGLTVALRSHSAHPYPNIGPTLFHAYRMHFVGGNTPEPYGYMPQNTTVNYMIGSSPALWRSKVPQYDAVIYSNLYDNIDFEIYGASNAIKYNFIVHANGDTRLIIIEYEGTDGVEVTRDGTLRIRTSVRDVVEMKPYAFQTVNGKQTVVDSWWRVRRTRDGYFRAYIEIGDYDHSIDLIIDPVLIFSTYTGSTVDNWGTTATYDSQRNVYTGGLVFGIGYPVSLGAYQSSFNGNCDIGIFKFDSSGTQRLYATYLGGSLADMPHSLIVNSFDELIVFGTTGSLDFPVTSGAYQTSHNGGDSLCYEDFDQIAFPQGSDIFVCRLSTDGTQLLASTYVGGSGNDGLNYRPDYSRNHDIIYGGNDSLYYNYGDGARGEIITDNLNNIYIGSTTFSTDFPTTPGCVQSTSGGRQDGVAFKLDHNLRTLLWSTYLGGTMDDAVYSIDVDSSYNLLVCGGTSSNDFPITEGSFQTSYGGGSADGFVSKISYGGERLIASSYVGDRFYDQLYFVRIGRHDEVFLYGQTHYAGPTFIYHAGYNVPNAGMLLMRLSPILTERRWSTLFGTAGHINLSPTAFAADICNRVYAAGWGRDFVGRTTSHWYTAGTSGMETTTDAWQDSTDGQDFYILTLDVNANSLEYATFFGELHSSQGNSGNGADHVDGGTSRFDRMGTLYQSVCASCSGTQGFPTTLGAWSDSNRAGNCNNALFRFNITDDFPVADFLLPESGCVPYSIQLTNTGRGTDFHWDFGDGSTSTEHNPTHTYTIPGTYTITLIASQPYGCSPADTQQHTVQVLCDTFNSHLPELLCNQSLLQIGVTPVLGATYSWSGDPVSDPTVANPWVDTTGTYILTTSASSCTQVDTFHVINHTLVDHWQTMPISCHDSSDGSVSFFLGNGIDPDSIDITIIPSAEVSYTDGDNLTYTFSGLSPSITYHAIINGYGCLYEQNFMLTNPDPPIYTKEFSATLCDDSCAGWITIHYTPDDITVGMQGVDTLIDGLCPGTYITALSSNGCPLIDTSIIRRDHTLDSLQVWVDRTDVYIGESVQLHASDGAANYLWSPAFDLDYPNRQNPTATPSDTLVCFTVVATAESGCIRSDTLCLHCTGFSCGEPFFTIPNAFTPNGDGINDRICFYSDVLTEFQIFIFNRWGQCVYESDDITSCWDGTFRGTPCLAGVYTYTCHIRCFGGIENSFKGDITLIR